ncbi:hypothetical protein AWB74_06102 [Caballeronia arvi]|uniref:Uncharacterized protein n=1 Tax=Caballeronia arvi TaxID=1777135 RepID=A0A158KLR8_9BURK|nr:hypothetical protein AWB74_06102 [Caballeronia arvi]
MTIDGNHATPGRMNLRQRLDWLFVTICVARYPIHTGAGELAVAYIAATGMPYTTHRGLLRSRHLTKDLAELHERGLVKREIVVLRQGGRIAVVNKYALTAKGRDQAKVIIARTICVELIPAAEDVYT